jgi:hypothetical protein
MKVKIMTQPEVCLRIDVKWVAKKYQNLPVLGLTSFS